MDFICAGLSKTGTTSFDRAMAFLGFRVLHWDTVRLASIIDGTAEEPNFRVYDDIEVVSDVPAALFFEELLEAYPDSRCILTVRDEDEWWDSIRRHFNERTPCVNPMEVGMRMRALAFGSPIAAEYVYRKRYREHNERVRAVVPAERLLELDITAPDAFYRLGQFVGRPVPRGTPFPHANQGSFTTERAAAEQLLVETIPPGTSTALVDSGWWWDGLTLPDRRVVRVTEGPPLWGAAPDGPGACDLVRSAAKDGFDFFALTSPAMWWLQHFPELVEHLAAETEEVYRDWQLALYRLT